MARPAASSSLLVVPGRRWGGWYRNPLRSSHDLKGLRIRIEGLGASVLKSVGADPQEMPVFGGGIQAAMKEGKIDAAEVQTPAADLRNGYPALAGIYHFPNWHEPSPTFDLFINSEKWSRLDDANREAVRLVARVLDEEMRDATVLGNARAFSEISAMPGVAVMPFPDDVLDVLARAAPDVIASELAGDPLALELYASLMDFQKTTSPWISVTDFAYLKARAMVR